VLCDRCGEREATIHEVLIQSGSKLESHLCEACAQSAATPASSVLTTGVDLGKSFGIGDPTPEIPTQAKDAVCPECGREWSSVRRTGLVGCPTCYEAFEDRLRPLIERAHEGGACHIGKSPRRRLESLKREGRDLGELLGDEHERAERMRLLRKQLGDALEQEQYERAAQIRDELGRAAAPGGDA